MDRSAAQRHALPEDPLAVEVLSMTAAPPLPSAPGRTAEPEEGRSADEQAERSSAHLPGALRYVVHVR